MVVVIGILGYLGLNKSKINHRGQGNHATNVGGTNFLGSSFWDYICLLRTHRESMIQCSGYNKERSSFIETLEYVGINTR